MLAKLGTFALLLLAGQASEVALPRADAETFQAWIWARQHPTDCSVAVGSYTRVDYFHALGLGAQMVSLKFNLLNALLRGQVYHLPTTQYANPLRCKSRSFACYFELPTNCSVQKGHRSSHWRSEVAKIHWCFDVPRRRLSRLAGLHSVYPKTWYHAQLAAYLYRPNVELRAFASRLLGGMEGNRSAARHSGGERGSSARSGGESRCVAMHVRRTDKHTEDHRMASRGFADFSQTLKSWAFWAYGGGASSLEVGRPCDCSPPEKTSPDTSACNLSPLARPPARPPARLPARPHAGTHTDTRTNKQLKRIRIRMHTLSNIHPKSAGLRRLGGQDDLLHAPSVAQAVPGVLDPVAPLCDGYEREQ